MADTKAVSLIIILFLHNRFVPASKSVSDAKTVIPMVKQPVFLRSMSAPSDLEMIANQDLEFMHAPQRYLSFFLFDLIYFWESCKLTGGEFICNL